MNNLERSLCELEMLSDVLVDVAGSMQNLRTRMHEEMYDEIRESVLDDLSASDFVNEFDVSEILDCLDAYEVFDYYDSDDVLGYYDSDDILRFVRDNYNIEDVVSWNY